MNKSDVELNILFLEYSRYVSRAHTIFSSFFEIALAVIFGTLGVAVALVEIEYIPWNKFYFLLTIFSAIIVIFFIGFIALYKWYDSRFQREKIINKIKIIGKII